MRSSRSREAKMREHRVPGVAIGIIDNGVVTHARTGRHQRRGSAADHRAHGVSDRLDLEDVRRDRDDAAGRAGQGRLAAPVRKYLPEFRVRDEAVSRDVTVWNLLTHTGGWEGQVSGPERGEDTLRNFVSDDRRPDAGRAAVRRRGATTTPASASPGRVIEAVTGTSINRAMRELVFTPLGLAHAGTTAGDFIVNRFAVGPRQSRRDSADAAAAVLAVGQRHGRRRRAVHHRPAGLREVSHGRRHRAPAASGVLTRASLERMRTRAAAQAEHRRRHRPRRGTCARWARCAWPRTAARWRGHILLLEIVPERNFAIGILTNAQNGWRLIQDVERAALESYHGATFPPNQAIAHRGLVETLPSAEPLAHAAGSRRRTSAAICGR